MRKGPKAEAISRSDLETQWEAMVQSDPETPRWLRDSRVAAMEKGAGRTSETRSWLLEHGAFASSS